MLWFENERKERERKRMTNTQTFHHFILQRISFACVCETFDSIIILFRLGSLSPVVVSTHKIATSFLNGDIQFSVCFYWHSRFWHSLQIFNFFFLLLLFRFIRFSSKKKSFDKIESTTEMYKNTTIFCCNIMWNWFVLLALINKWESQDQNRN